MRDYKRSHQQNPTHPSDAHRRRRGSGRLFNRADPQAYARADPFAHDSWDDAFPQWVMDALDKDVPDWPADFAKQLTSVANQSEQVQSLALFNMCKKLVKRGDWPSKGCLAQHAYKHQKWTLDDETIMQAKTPALFHVLQVLKGRAFIRWLERLTGIAPLFADPTNNGGGLHKSWKHTYLRTHADFESHPTKNLTITGCTRHCHSNQKTLPPRAL